MRPADSVTGAAGSGLGDDGQAARGSGGGHPDAQVGHAFSGRGGGGVAPERVVGDQLAERRQVRKRGGSAWAACERPQLAVSGSVILMSVRWSGSSLVEWSEGGQMSAILAGPVLIEVMAMAGPGARTVADRPAGTPPASQARPSPSQHVAGHRPLQRRQARRRRAADLRRRRQLPVHPCGITPPERQPLPDLAGDLRSRSSPARA